MKIKSRVRNIITNAKNEDAIPHSTAKLLFATINQENNDKQPVATVCSFTFTFPELTPIKVSIILGNVSKAKYYIKIVDVLRATEFIRIVVTEEDHAYDLFERVNARGTSLEVSDLLKNHLHSNKADVSDMIVARSSC